MQLQARTGLSLAAAMAVGLGLGVAEPAQASGVISGLPECTPIPIEAPAFAYDFEDGMGPFAAISGLDLRSESLWTDRAAAGVGGSRGVFVSAQGGPEIRGLIQIEPVPAPRNTRWVLLSFEHRYDLGDPEECAGAGVACESGILEVNINETGFRAVTPQDLRR